jgi:cytoskeletal protein RodZ
MAQPLHPPPARPAEPIAARLRRAREDKGWSLDELSIKTRIPVRHLESIEAGRGPDIPGGFIGKSFVRQYAEAVGLDGNQALREFVAQTGVNLEVAFQERKISPFTPDSLKRFQAKMWRNIGIGAVVFALLILGITYFVTRTPKSSLTKGPVFAERPAAESGSATSSTPAPTTALGEQAPAATTTPAVNPANALAPTTPNPAAGPKPPTPQPPQRATGPSLEPSAPAGFPGNPSTPPSTSPSADSYREPSGTGSR